MFFTGFDDRFKVVVACQYDPRQTVGVCVTKRAAVLVAWKCSTVERKHSAVVMWSKHSAVVLRSTGSAVLGRIDHSALVLWGQSSAVGPAVLCRRSLRDRF
mmetsp:Transcript_29274/g.97277  ORF Transcript_29274/g.97277 Transcript_29274/m.97277 type:complete len:101 (+) Transcript_29274:1504-1806(+)